MKLQELFTEIIEENRCIHCGNIVNEDLRNWFKSKWVNIGKKDKSGKHPPCGTSGDNKDMRNVFPLPKPKRCLKKKKNLQLVERGQHKTRQIVVVKNQEDKEKNL